MAKCIQPDAPWANCCVCGTPIKTCGEKEFDEKDEVYICPEHPEGCQLDNGEWVCSMQCWETAADVYD